MFDKILLAMLASLLTALVGASAAYAQNSFPSKAIRILTSDAGGGADVSARIIAQAIATPLGQQVIVDNRGGVIPGDMVAHAQPDGYTLLYYGSSIWLLPLLTSSVPFDMKRDFAPVTLATSSPAVLIVHPSVPARSVKELIALAKSKPGAIDYATASTGTSNHLAAELFKSMAGIAITRIPYKGNGQALNAVVAGEAQIMFPAAGSVDPHIKSGRVRALAVTGTTRTVAYPDLPTISESGLPGYGAVSLIGMFAPMKTPTAVIAKLNTEIVAALHKNEIKDRLRKLGVDAVGSSPEQFAQRIDADFQRMSKVIKEAGLGDKS